ncbi:MAG: flagellar motor switch protein FliM [Alphaproteobacteria bacterium]|nr:flagellar motor switch protein FliM [Alphaproteobacteria bacterium]
MAETPENPPGTASADSGRVLNQDEVDSLLGFDSEQGAADASGIYAIMDKSIMAYEKLPMVEVVFDRLVRQLSTSLRAFTSDNVDVSLDSMSSLRFDDYLNAIPLPALLVVFRAVEWENFGIVTVDSSLIYTMVDILLGGRRQPKPGRVESRPYTTIEQDLVRRMVDVVLADLSAAFEPLSPATFQFDRLETNPRFATIARPANAVLLVRLRVDIEERNGFIQIMLPHATLEPIRELLLQMFMGEKFGQDTVWEKHLGKELHHTMVDLHAVLNEKEITLGEVMRFRVGSTILLDCMLEDEIVLKCGDVPVTRGKLGRVGDHMAVSLSKPVAERQEEG